MNDGAAQLCVTGYGAVTAVGLTAVQSAASVRAGICRLGEHPLAWSMTDPPFFEEPEPLVCAAVATLEPVLAEPDRFLNLALAPLQELVSSAGLQREDIPRAGLFLALPYNVASVVGPDVLLYEFRRRAAWRQLALQETVCGGPTGFFRALAMARDALAAGRCWYALVGAVDSHLGEATMRRLDEAGRLRSPRSRDGFFPGEAGAWLWLEQRALAERRGVMPRAVLHGPVLAWEPQPFTGDRQSTGTGLTTALRGAVSGCGVAPRWVIADLNGESFRAFEWGLAVTRLGADLAGLREVTHPADCWGDVGTAGPPLFIMLACEAFRRRWAPARQALVFAGHDAGERGAAVVAAAIT
jgi:3-oxoacyl-[acyl-carrier-protein] synthase I